MIFRVFHIFIVFLLLLSCEKAPLSNGPLKQEQREVSGFHHIKIYDIEKVYIKQGTSCSVTVEAGENILPSVVTECASDTLVIDNEVKMRWLREYEMPVVYITIDSLHQVFVKEPSNVITQNTIKTRELIYWAIARLCECDVAMDCERFHVKSAYNTFGDLTFSGSCESALIWTYYATNVFAESLIVKQNEVKSHTTGDIYVYASDQLKVEVNASGNIYYSGNPGDVTIEKNSTGEVIAGD